jgi:adenosylcobinamide-GDP ribazoletransferase
MRSALQFLTVFPVRAPQGYGAAWFPWIGALLGLIAAATLRLPQGPLLCLIAMAALTGALHEDGLADVCDAIRSYRTRERMLEILHDSRIGAHGALALVFSVLLRWQALEHLTGNPWLRLPAAIGIARGTIVLLAACTPAAGSGLGHDFRASITNFTAVAVLAQTTALALLAGVIPALWLILLQTLLLAASRAWFIARLGGVTGDCLGFHCQLSEAVTLVLFTCI